MNKEKNRRKSKDENNKNNLNEEENFNLKFNTKLEEKNKGYDIVIDIRSFKSLIFNGWRIKFPNGNELKTYEKKKNNETIVVGVIGNGNKGKSFTLQKLSEYKIPKGFSLATEGLSIKYSDLKEKNICILDSAGREGPLIKMVNGEVNEESVDSNENSEEDENENNNNVNNEDEEEDVKEEEIIKNNNNIINNNNRNNKYVKMNSTKNAQRTYKKNINNISTENINEVPPLPNQSPNSKNIIHIDNINENKDLKKILNEKFEEENEEENIEEYSRDKLLTEYFLEKFILQKSNVLIIVVGPMTISEQKLLTKLKNQSLEKDLFVIHNLQNYIYIKQVKNYIKNTLLKLRMINLKKRIYQNIDFNNNNNNENEQKNKIYYIEEKNKKNIIHLILANDYSEAGEYYNTTTISYLKKKIEGIEKRKKFAVIEEIQEFLLKYSKELIEENLKKENIIFDQNKNSIKLKNINSITLKKYLVDELDFNIQKDGYLPKFSYVVKDNKLVIKIELPGGGKIKPSLEITKGDYIFKFEGEKNGDLEIENDKKNNEKKIKLEFNNRENGKYVLNINIPQNVIHINNISNKPKLIEKEKGVFCYEYEVEYLLDKKENNNENEVEDEYNV